MIGPSNNPGEDSLDDYKDYFPGHNAIAMRKVVNAIEEKMTGKVITVYDNH